MSRIVFATGNEGKMREIRDIMSDMEMEVVSMKEALISVEVEENGTTFEENAVIKAQAIAAVTDDIVLADDSGLCVEALNGEPGIHSARYAETPQARIDKLLNNLTDVANRKAKFVCAMTLVDEFGNILDKEIGECYGEIATVQSGTNGFGYDPVFIVDGYGVTMADMSEDLKNTISHRANALSKIISFIKSELI